MKILTFVKCKIFNNHNWTCAAQEGIKPSEEQLQNGVDGFFDYAKMYCKDCGKIYKDLGS